MEEHKLIGNRNQIFFRTKRKQKIEQFRMKGDFLGLIL